MFLLGLSLGVISRLLDIYTEILGNIFSQMAIWILLGTLIAIFSPTKKKAMLNIFPFCIGIVAVSVLLSILMFDRLRFYDFIIDALLIYFLFFKKLERQ